MKGAFPFRVEAAHGESGARAGVFETPHAVISTPVFMPVGTLATVKSLDPTDLRTLGAEIILGNTYHLALRPGAEVVEALGGLHRFMSWNRAILTDSGGFQVFSLAHLRRIEEDGVTFRAHTDGSLHTFTPESVVRIQEQLGPDIMMVLDECPPHTMTFDEARVSLERTTRWAERARVAQTRDDMALFGIVQGGMYTQLRREGARQLVSLDFPGYGIGGLGVGEPKALMYEMLEASVSELPADRPRYLMGIGAPEDLFAGVAAGVDMFDCVLQTRVARNGALFTDAGRVNIRNARFARDPGPIAAGCECMTCRTFSRAYLHHLFRNQELLAYRLASIHNLHWTIALMARIRASILTGIFGELRRAFLAGYRLPDEAVRQEQRVRREAAMHRTPLRS